MHVFSKLKNGTITWKINLNFILHVIDNIDSRVINDNINRYVVNDPGRDRAIC